MTQNPICAEMRWPVPAADELLVIKRSDGLRIAFLLPSKAGEFEGVYLWTSAFGEPNACFSAAYDRRPAAIRAGLARKLFANARNLKKGELATMIERLSQCRIEIGKTNELYGGSGDTIEE